MTTTFEDVVAHRDAMLDVFTEITQDCQLLGLTPVGVQLNRWSDGTLDVGVQFAGADTTAVDTLAASYGFGPATADHPNYQRVGRLDVDGRSVEIHVFTARPSDVDAPAAHAPEAVEA